MKLLAGIIITVSLILGTISAATAYNPTLDAIDPSGPALTLNAPAGRDPGDPARPLLDPASVDEPVLLTPDRLQGLRDFGVRRVRVKEFGWSRWDGRWLFLVSCVGLIAGAAVIRVSARKAMEAARAVERHPTETPDHALAATREELTRVIAARDAAPNEATRLGAIVEVLDEIRRTHQPAIEDAQQELISRLGRAGHARFMDRWAATERQLHRAWSAAIDGVPEESEACLRTAVTCVESAIERMASGSS